MLGEHYRQLLERQIVPPSWVVAVLPPQREECPTITEMLKLCEQLPLDIEDAQPATPTAFEFARWEMEFKVAFDDGQAVHMHLGAFPTEEVDQFHIEQGRLNPQEADQAKGSAWSLGLFVEFGLSPLTDYLQQLKVMSALAPDAVLFMDVTACTAHGAAWVHEVAVSSIPPSLQSLFTIHEIYPDDGTRVGHWLHTHGLLRCGMPELEMLDVPADASGVCGHLMNSVAALFMEQGLPRPGEVFAPGYGLDLVWVPWEQTLGRLSRRKPGNRSERDEPHRVPSAVLFTPRRGWFGRKLKSPVKTLTRLKDDLVLYVSTMETERMTALARERFGSFAGLFDRFGSSEAFAFLIKIGFPLGDVDSDTEYEHLWFQVHALSGQDACEGTLLNQPYHVDLLSEGDRGQHDLTEMSDWSIMCEHGRFDPDSVLHLVRILDG